MNDNRRVGLAFERDFCKTLYQQGWWLHRAVQSQAGQPADVIAIYNGKPMLIDCKVCKNDIFPIRRIEPNQHSAMVLWSQRVNRHTYFALKMSDGTIHIANYFSLINHDKKTLNKEDIEEYPTMERWLKEWIYL